MKACWDCLLKKDNIPGGDWHPGWGRDPLYLNPSRSHLPNAIFCGKPFLVPFFQKSHFESKKTHQTPKTLKSDKKQKTQRNLREIPTRKRCKLHFRRRQKYRLRGVGMREIPKICCWWWWNPQVFFSQDWKHQLLKANPTFRYEYTTSQTNRRDQIAAKRWFTNRKKRLEKFMEMCVPKEPPKMSKVWLPKVRETGKNTSRCFWLQNTLWYKSPEPQCSMFMGC